MVNLFRLSKTLCKILRHNAEKIGLKIRSDGFCYLDEVLKCNREIKKLEATIEDV